MTFPTIRPELTLDFANSRQLDPRITFSRSSSATYLNPDTGLITLASEHEARFEKEGLLNEEGRTNVISYSTAPDNQFNQDSSNFTYTFNQPAPDGSNDAYLMENVSNTSTNRGGQFSNYATIPTTGKITVSVFVKPIGGQVIALGGDNGNQGYYGIPLVKYDFTVSPPVPSNTSNNGQHGFTAEPFIQEIGNGWYRLIEVIDLTNGTGFLNGQTRGPRVSNTTPGTSTVVWGYQIETSSFPTSYIPTAGQSGGVARATELCLISGQNFSSWHNTSYGTYLAIGDQNALDTNGYQNAAGESMYTDRYFNLTTQRWRATFWRVLQNTSSVLGVFSIPPIGAGQQVKTATAWTTDELSAATLGVPSPNNPASWATAFPALTELRIGYSNRLLTQDMWNGHISRLSYYSRRLSDSELQTITL